MPRESVPRELGQRTGLFERLQALFPRFLGHARKQLGRDATDVVLEMYMHAARSKPLADGLVAEPTAYCWKILKNLIRNEHRRRSRHGTPLPLDEKRDSPQVTSADEEMEDEEMEDRKRGLVAENVPRLDPSDQQIIEMLHEPAYEGWNSERKAEHLGISAEAFRTRQSRALKKLKRMMIDTEMSCVALDLLQRKLVLWQVEGRTIAEMVEEHYGAELEKLMDRPAELAQKREVLRAELRRWLEMAMDEFTPGLLPDLR